MDPERVQAYLQAACSGLGFDIGEIWWTSNENGSSSVAAIAGHNSEGVRHLRFVQLYTSKSYEDRRPMLVSPDQKEVELQQDSDLKKHVLSPQLVNAISSSAQVLWATSQKREGLLGRSDVRLQTAVGMPVAVDAKGNMCVVVMFSPNQIRNTDDAMEYLQFISQSATSSNIPCLLPVFNNTMRVPVAAKRWVPTSLGDGVTARFVTLEDTDKPASELSLAPKDCFGIPMLPAMAELGGGNDHCEDELSAFDDATYGVWSTIMDSMEKPMTGPLHPPTERLEEFATAFLNMSVFDAADVWIPQQNSEGVSQVVSVVANDALHELRSKGMVISNWSGAVGRAYASGTPVWSHNREIIFDHERRHVLERAGVQTILAVPVANCVLACYSLVRTDTVPFVLQFLQKALRLLWAGLNNVEKPSVEQEIWRDVGPADLGEMAADLEMHQEFLKKKRPHGVMSTADGSSRDRSESLSLQLESLDASISGSPVVPFSSNAHFSIEPYTEETGGTEVSPQHAVVPVAAAANDASPTNSVTLDVRGHLRAAVQSVGQIVPWTSTNVEGTKRLHMATTDQEGPNHIYVESSNQSIAEVMGPSVPSQTAAFRPSQESTLTFHSPAPIYYVPLQMPEPLPNRIMEPPTPPSGGELLSHVNHGNTVSSSFVDGVYAPQIHSTTQELHHFAPQTYHIHEHLPSGTILSSQSVPPPSVSIIGVSQDAAYCQPAASQGEKVCRIQGCGEPAVVRRPYCMQHSGNRLCEQPGCSKCAQGSTRFCIAHGGGRRCTFPGCDKGARDKYFCAAHGGGKRCSAPGCSKSAVGGSNLCTGHGGGRRCDVEGCDKSAQSSTKFCVKHGGGKKCSNPTCQKVARGRTSFCAAHGGGVRCKLEGCNRVAIGKLQLCRAHGGGARTKTDTSPLYENEVSGTI